MENSLRWKNPRDWKIQRVFSKVGIKIKSVFHNGMPFSVKTFDRKDRWSYKCFLLSISTKHDWRNTILFKIKLNINLILILFIQPRGCVGEEELLYTIYFDLSSNSFSTE